MIRSEDRERNIHPTRPLRYPRLPIHARSYLANRAYWKAEQLYNGLDSLKGNCMVLGFAFHVGMAVDKLDQEFFERFHPVCPVDSLIFRVIDGRVDINLIENASVGQGRFRVQEMEIEVAIFVKGLSGNATSVHGGFCHYI